MKPARHLFLSTCIAALALNLQAQELLIKPHDVIAIGGDSITFQRAYTVLIEDYFLMCQPIEGVRVAQFGSAGETSGGFASHMTSDALRIKPTVLLTLFGMNDGRYMPFDPPHEEGYRKGQASIIAQAKQAGVRIHVLGSPTCVDPAKYHTETSTHDVYNAALKRYGEIGHEIVEKTHEQGLLYAPVNELFMDVMNKGKAADPKFLMCADGVHPLNDGHLTMAYTFLKTLGCDGAIATISIDLTANTATGTPGHRIVSTKDGACTVESSRYPFCFWGSPTDYNNTLSALPYFPFNQDLNRFQLVITGITAPKAKVTWGTQSKVFTKAELTAGINLAAEFIDNPFVAQFKKVDKAVHDQQDQEDFLLHWLLFRLNDAKKNFPGTDADFDRIVEKAFAQDLALGQAAAAFVVPITHTIRVEPVSAP